MCKIGIALTTFNKFEEAAIATKIIRSWKHDYVIGLASNNPNGRQLADDAGVDYDVFTQVRDIPFNTTGFFTRKTPWTTKKEVGGHFAIRLRIMESVRASCKAMLNTRVDYVIHTHADGWLMDESALRKLVSDMDKKNKRVACRGKGIEYTWHPFRNCNSFGQVDDHCFIFDRAFADHRRLWDFKPEAMLYHKHSIHALLAILFAVKIGFENVWWYRKTQNLLDLFEGASSSLNPTSYDPYLHFIHVNRGTLPGDWGKSVQAGFLRMYGYDMLQEYYDYDIHDKILEANQKYDLRMRLYGFPKNVRDNWSPVMKERFIKNTGILTLVKNYYHLLGKKFLDSIFKTPSNGADFYRSHCGIDGFAKDNWAQDFYEEWIG